MIKLVADGFYVVKDASGYAVAKWVGGVGRNGWYFCGNEEVFPIDGVTVIRRVRLPAEKSR